MKKKRLIGFLCVAAILQGVIMFGCTEAGLMKVYPVLFRICDEEYHTDGPNTVYYDMRLAISEAPLVVVGVDFSVAETYDVFLHLFRFLKQYQNITQVYFHEDFSFFDSLAASLAEPDAEVHMPEVLADFSDGLSAMNETMTPARKFTVGTMPADVRNPAQEGAVLCVMDRDRMMAEKDVWSSRGALCVEMKYVFCASADGEIREDIQLPFVGEDVRFSFLSQSQIQWFYTYFDAVTSLYGKQSSGDESRLSSASAEYVICIANGHSVELSD